MLTVGGLFSGIGGMEIGLQRAGMQIEWMVEIDPFCQKVLARHWPNVVRYGDVRECGRHNLEPVDLICGGFPCQPHSVAGKRRGAADDRNLWPEYRRIIEEMRPRWVFAENVLGIRTTILDQVLSDLENLAYTTGMLVIPACAFDAPHRRERIFVVAHSNDCGCGQLFQSEQESGRKKTPNAGSNGKTWSLAHTASERKTTAEQQGQLRSTQQGSQDVADTDEPRLAQRQSQRSDTRTQQPSAFRASSEGRDVAHTSCQSRDGGDDNGRCRPRSLPELGDCAEEARSFGSRRTVEPDLGMLADGLPTGLVGRGWLPEPPVGRVATGIPDRVAKLKALGNAVVPIVIQWIGERIIECALDNDESRAIIDYERS